MLKVDLITGFLGSGKTTLLLKYARYLMRQGLRIGILEYDYGTVNVDMVLLSGLRGDNCELEMVAAGCDEDCLKRRFKTKLIAMAMSGYDRVIIEPSGIFDMDLFFDTLRDEPLDEWYEIGSIITVVSAELEENLGDEENFVLASQASCAGRVIFSRTQLSNEKKLAEVKAHLERAAAEIHCRRFEPVYVEKNWDNLNDEDFKELKESGYHVGEYEKVTAGEKSGFSSVCFLEVPEGLDALKEKINKLFEEKTYGNIFRVKGFVLSDGACYEINATKEKVETRKASGRQILIIIGTELNQEAIDTLIKCVKNV
ncbi:MAG: GTP-binding protein [Lachnospiraceae bacterium]|nr:GTP-binding protein [Lachnospiraceae bacterium]